MNIREDSIIARDLKIEVWHNASQEAARSIDTYGFRDQDLIDTAGRRFVGVLVTSKPINWHEGQISSVFYKLRIREDSIAKHLESDMPGEYRKWRVPAGILNQVVRQRIDANTL